MRRLGFQHAGHVRSLFEQYPPFFSEFTFSNLMMWSDQRPTYFEKIDETTQFYVEEEGELVAFGAPFGPAGMHEILPKLSVKKASGVPLPEKPISGWKFSVEPGDADYVYRVSDLVEYPGRKYRRKRQLMRGCLSRYDCQYETLTEEVVPECLDLQKKIIERRAPDEEQMREHEAARFLMTHFSRFHSFGCVIRVDGSVEGVMIASLLNQTTAVAHIEKINADIHGLSALLHHWFAKKGLQNYQYLNVEQDLGVPGLRESKERFKPDHMVVKYTGVTL